VRTLTLALTLALTLNPNPTLPVSIAPKLTPTLTSTPIQVCTGVFAHQLCRGDPPVEAFAWGLAAASARVTRQLPGFDPAKVWG
jgi:hypothetical protein